MPKPGRKHRQNVARYPGGSIRNDHRGERPEDIMRTVLSYRIRSGVKPEHATDQRAGYSLGRLNLAGTITDLQYQAGMRWARTVLRYASVMGLPPPYPKSPTVMLLADKLTSEDVEHLASLDDPRFTTRKFLTEEERIERAKSAYEDAFAELRDLVRTQGIDVRPVVTGVCVRDDEIARDVRAIGDLRTGLNVLVRFWGMT